MWIYDHCTVCVVALQLVPGPCTVEHWVMWNPDPTTKNCADPNQELDLGFSFRCIWKGDPLQTVITKADLQLGLSPVLFIALVATITMVTISSWPTTMSSSSNCVNMKWELHFTLFSAGSTCLQALLKCSWSQITAVICFYGVVYTNLLITNTLL